MEGRETLQQGSKERKYLFHPVFLVEAGLPFNWNAWLQKDLQDVNTKHKDSVVESHFFSHPMRPFCILLA